MNKSRFQAAKAAFFDPDLVNEAETLRKAFTDAVMKGMGTVCITRKADAGKVTHEYVPYATVYRDIDDGK